MSGKKAQRTKGNTQPSSSSRSAKFLQHEGQSGLITFSGLTGNTSGVPLQEIGDGGSLDGEMRLLLRKMAKKDAITKLKAVQEFTVLCKEKDSEAIKNILNFWPRMYNKLAHDFDHRVREATQQAHYQVTTKAGRNLAPQLKQIIVNWLMSHFDNHLPAANNAKMSFDQVFQEKKRKEVLLFCKKEILQVCEKNILRETVDTLSDPKIVPLEERETKYNRFVSSTFHVLRYVLENMEADEYDDDLKEKLSNMFVEKKFWKHGKHESPMIRTSFYTCLLTLCEKLASTMEGALQHISAVVLTNMDEEDPIVTKALWDVLLYSLSTFTNMWQFVNVRKAVWPKLWKLLNAGCYGNVNVIYPNLLPFLSNIPPEIAGEGTGFYAEFFSHIVDILVTKKKTLSDGDATLVIGTYMECMRLLLMKYTSNKELCDFIVLNLISEKLHNIFHSSEEYKSWYKVFIKELQLLLSRVNEATKNNENSSHYKIIHTDLWAVICSVVFAQCDDDRIKFKFAESADGDSNSTGIKTKFYTSLMDFLSYCYKNMVVNNISDCAGYSNGHCDDEDLFTIFIRKIIKCFIGEIFGTKQFGDGEQLVKLVSLSFNIDLIKCVCVEKLNWENNKQVLDGALNIDICTTFVNLIIIPLLATGVDYEKAIVEVTMGLVTVLHGTEKRDYLVSLFEKDMFSGFVLLASFVEVFKYSEDEFVLAWLKSDFVEEEVMKLCTPKNDDDDKRDDHVKLIWQILRMYIQIIKENPDKLILYHNKLLMLIKHCIKRGHRSSQNIDDSIFSTFASLCTSSFEGSAEFQETLFIIFQHNVLHDQSSNSVDAMNGGFTMLMNLPEDKGFKEMVNKIITFAKDCCADRDLCSKLSTTICSLMHLSQKHSNVNEVSYGKEMMKEIIESGEANMMEIIENGDEKMVSSNMFKFYSQFFKVVSFEDTALLETCCDKKLYDVILECFADATTAREAGPEAASDIKECIKTCEFLHFNLVDCAMNKCLQGNIEVHIVKELLQTFVKNDQLSELIVDHILMLTSPSTYNYTEVVCDTYCMVVSIVNDISCSRALVEMYVDELRNNEGITNNSKVFGQFIKVLSCIICRWYEILNSLESDLQDYYDVIDIIITCIVKWKDDHSEMVLFSCSLVDSDPCVISLNINLIHLIYQCVQTALEVFKAEQLDFLLCSMISWMQSCEESLDCFETHCLYPQFMHTSFKLFNMIACVFDSNPSSTNVCNISPSIYLKETSVQCIPSLNEDTTAEWKELFLPTAGTSLLRIYIRLTKSSVLNNRYAELEQTLCSCIRFIPAFTIHEFVCSEHDNDSDKQKAIEEFCSVCCKLLYSGSWCNKVGSYQLLTGLGEIIEGKLCYISQKEDEDHEGMRSFPSSLIQTMENSRDETLKVLSAEGVSIKDPLKSFEHMKGKLALLTYLLSWQLILQLFKMANPSNRALFANYFHNNSDVHDLLTCLFCLMSQSVNFENKKKVILQDFTFSEIRQVAFHLLTTSMQCIPALIRNWFNNHLGRADTGTVNRFVSNLISPLLLNNEFQNLNESSKEFNNMIVKTRAVAREIAAVYTVDEVSMELVVQLGANHPLSPVSVSCGKRIGVSNSLWRQWMLQLNTFLSFQNGSILDGLVLWKRNVDKRFEGVEECMVCFSVLHGSNYSLPSIGCKTCKKKFHPACLYKWFNTSGKCTCPLCRNTF